MLAKRFPPGIILSILGAHLVLWLMAKLAEPAGIFAPQDKIEWWVRTPLSLLAYSIAALLNLEIAREHRGAPWLRVAWLGFAANAALSLPRMCIETHLLDFLWSQTPHNPLRGLLLQSLILPANLGLLVGVLAMCWAYHGVGLGFEIKGRDWSLMAVGGVLLLGLFTFRAGLTEAQSPFAVSRILQQSALALLAVVAVGSIVLHRMALRMGSSKLEKSLRVLTIYVLGRSALALIDALTIMPDAQRFRIYFGSLAWQTVLWLPALAAAYRAQIAVEAARDIARLEQREAAAGAALAQS